MRHEDGSSPKEELDLHFLAFLSLKSRENLFLLSRSSPSGVQFGGECVDRLGILASSKRNENSFGS